MLARRAGQERPGIMRVNFYATYDVRFEFGPGNDMEGRLCTVVNFGWNKYGLPLLQFSTPS